MNTLTDIKNTYAKEQGFYDWETFSNYYGGRHPEWFEQHYDEICIRAQKAALEKAARSAVIGRVSCGDCKCIPAFYCPENKGIIKESITNPENLIR